jgi:hypothetical protein
MSRVQVYVTDRRTRKGLACGSMEIDGYGTADFPFPFGYEYINVRVIIKEEDSAENSE